MCANMHRCLPPDKQPKAKPRGVCSGDLVDAGAVKGTGEERGDNLGLGYAEATGDA